MASESESEDVQAQAAVATCTVHIREKVYFYCKKCKKRICDVCFRGEHSQHDWCMIDKYAQQLRQESQQTAKKIIDEIIAPLKASKKDAKKELEKTKIRQMQQTMKKAIDVYADKLVSIVDDVNDDKKDEEIDRKIREFEKIANFFAKDAHTAYDSAVVEMDEELQRMLQDKEITKTEAQDDVVFQEGDFKSDSMILMFGKLLDAQDKPRKSNVDVSIIKTLQLEKEEIRSMNPTPKGKLWINMSNHKEITLIDLDGKKIEKRDAETLPNDFFVKDDDIIYTSERGISRLGVDNVTEICSSSPMFNTGICQSYDGNGMLVCLIECGVQNITTTTKGEVHHIDMAGYVRRRYHEQQADHTKLFTYPWRVAQNINSDLCVIDRLDKERRSRLVLLSVDGILRSSYSGQSSMKYPFFIWDVVCDSIGRIIVSDVKNNAVHMLNQDGQFLQFLLTEKDRILGPCSLALYKDTLSVVCSQGVIKICKMKSKQYD